MTFVFAFIKMLIGTLFYVGCWCAGDKVQGPDLKTQVGRSNAGRGDDLFGCVGDIDGADDVDITVSQHLSPFFDFGAF